MQKYLENIFSFKGCNGSTAEFHDFLNAFTTFMLNYKTEESKKFLNSFLVYINSENDPFILIIAYQVIGKCKYTNCVKKEDLNCEKILQDFSKPFILENALSFILKFDFLQEMQFKIENELVFNDGYLSEDLLYFLCENKNISKSFLNTNDIKFLYKQARLIDFLGKEAKNLLNSKSILFYENLCNSGNKLTSLLAKRIINILSGDAIYFDDKQKQYIKLENLNFDFFFAAHPQSQVEDCFEW
ncbi:hypothetical protein EHP00_298 [Ecytonucleospora hepatopenaei]|uniref:Uncharacterized protein n=1 Tax=Ecytonucleospora hepatopenaei TaxID=646526 RepID=A0A1W0E799_9MICR|nr:hypothetical protein EHP00_298 [Ecytonucleospora hepatopenaei]